MSKIATTKAQDKLKASKRKRRRQQASLKFWRAVLKVGRRTGLAAKSSGPTSASTRFPRGTGGDRQNPWRGQQQGRPEDPFADDQQDTDVEVTGGEDEIE